MRLLRYPLLTLAMVQQLLMLLPRAIVVVGGVAAAAAGEDELNPVIIQNYKFFDSVTEEEMVIRGVDYYPRPNEGDLNLNSQDFFTHEFRHIWERDIPNLKELGVNAIRLYAVDPEGDHDAFMCALQESGIYVIVALAHDCPTCAITRDEAPDCYPPELKQQGQAVINSFAKYPNTLGFSAGNEVNHFTPLDQPEWNAPCQKKFIRDMREYIDSCSSSRGMRKVPVGAVLADSDRDANAMYYNCRGDPNDEFETTEWYGLNSYVFCDGKAKTYEEALGLNTLQKHFESYRYSIPVLLTEFGCLSRNFPTVDGYAGQRNFNQARWMLERPELREQFAGGFAFEYSMEKSNAGGESPYPFETFGHQNYGLGYLGPEHCDDVSQNCEYHPLPNYYNLKQIYTDVNITNATTLDGFVAAPDRRNYTQCPKTFPPLGSFEWEADHTKSLSCPSRREVSFTCSAPFDVHIAKSQGASAEGVGALLAFIVAFICVLGCIFRRSMCQGGSNYQDTNDSSFAKANRAADDESTELLTTQRSDRDTTYKSSDGSFSSSEGVP